MALGIRVLVLAVFLSVLASFVPVGIADAQAQQPAAKVYRIGFLSQGQPPKAWVEALQQGLRERGYVEGRNLVWEFRSTDGSLEQLPQFAEELVRLKVDVIVARAASGAMAAKGATTSVPIVFAGVLSPVEIGLVPSLSRPGGNITGVALNSADMSGKRLQLLTELVPALKRVAILSHPAHPTSAVQVRAAAATARALGVQLLEVPLRGGDDFDPALKSLRGIGGLLHVDGPLFTTYRTRLVEAAARTRLPAIYAHRGYVDVGGLMSYGVDLADAYRRTAPYVDKILKGAKPGDLPVEQPTKYELVINKRTAKAFGLAIPPSLLVRADQIVE
jgi:putative ABC transport system substrate-binding protein